MVSDAEMLWQRAKLIPKLVAASVRASEKAGSLIKTILKEGDLQAIEKTGKDDLQTKADRVSQDCIVSSLRKHFGAELAIIGEEDGINASVSDECIETEVSEEVLRLAASPELEDVDMNHVVVWVDPLDGTSEFWEYSQNPDNRVGIAVDNKPFAGVIHQPYYRKDGGKQSGRTVWGITGLGVFGITPSLPKNDQRVIVTSRSHVTKHVTAAIDALQPTKVLRVGGAGHKVLLLIDGQAHAYVFASAGCKRWDTCAPEAVLTTLDGKLTDLFGNVYDYSRGTSQSNSLGVLATAPNQDHSFYVKSIPAEVKDVLSKAA